MKNKKGLIKRLEDFEMHHKVIAFIVIMVVTILFVRLSVMVHNPNPTIFNFELHHFDYGMLLLLVMCLFLLFGKKKNPLYILLTAIAFGLILDDIWFIRSNILDPGVEEISLYNATFPIVILLILSTIIAILLINHFRKLKNSSNR
jgi:hypothetical protein